MTNQFTQEFADLPLSPQMLRHHAAQLAVKHYRDADCEDAELIATAAALAAFIDDGTVPASADDVPAIAIVRNDEQIEIQIDGEVVASTTYDQAGHAGMDAVGAAALRVARALNYEPEETRP